MLADISEEVLGGGLQRDEPLLEGTVSVVVCCGIWLAAEFTSEVMLLSTGLFERWLMFDDISPDCEVWDEGLPESEENSPLQKLASRLRLLMLLTLFSAVQITSETEGLKKKEKFIRTISKSI